MPPLPTQPYTYTHKKRISCPWIWGDMKWKKEKTYPHNLWEKWKLVIFLSTLFFFQMAKYFTSATFLMTRVEFFKRSHIAGLKGRTWVWHESQGTASAWTWAKPHSKSLPWEMWLSMTHPRGFSLFLFSGQASSPTLFLMQVNSSHSPCYFFFSSLVHAQPPLSASKNLARVTI